MSIKMSTTTFSEKEKIMINVTLYHDGCNICQSISATMTAAFATPNHNFESINLDVDRNRTSEAQALGITRLPSLVIDGKIMRLEDHSPIEHYA
jgi:urate oxidase